MIEKLKQIGEALLLVWPISIFIVIIAVVVWEERSKRKKAKTLPFRYCPQDFKVGQVYKMAVASRSHVTKPYYVYILQVKRNGIETNIPNHHMLWIEFNSLQWEYHIPRMTYVGMDTDPKIKRLLYNQEGLIPEK
jgi:hypothetical protein